MKIDESTIDHNVLLAIKGVTENMADNQLNLFDLLDGDN